MSDSIAVLLHAAARGAKLEVDLQSGYGWESNWQQYMPVKGDGFKWRIHQKDAHLRYGPISSVLVESAKNPSMPEDSVFPSIWPISMLWQLTEYYRFAEADELTKSLFLLMVAESLIEDGL